ncbi:MAG: glycosyltransferase family 2 protein [Patescibacteria group bacterium]
MNDQAPSVDVIVLLYKNAQFMSALFAGLAEQDYPRERMTVHFVDNNPGDGSLDKVRELVAQYGERIAQIKIHEPGKNLAFTGGNNLVMRESLERGADYCYLLNGDASFEPGALGRAVAAAESEPKIGAVQSLIVLQQNPQEINTSGNALHYLGFGYSQGYHAARSSAPKEHTEIAYFSGAGVLLKNTVLREIGLFDETLWMYHEDLDLGWRIRLAGYRIILAPESVVRHYYEFSRSISKWYWMERNRWIVLLKNYRLATLLWLLPQLIAADLVIFIFAVFGGWWPDKLRVWGWFLKPSAWKYLVRERRKIARLRKADDKDILTLTVPTIAYQDVESTVVKILLNPIGRLLRRITLAVVFW